MPTVIAHHNVKDRDHWLTSSKREEVFGPLGVTNIRTFVDPQNPTRVACRAGQLLGQSGPADARTRGHALRTRRSDRTEVERTDRRWLSSENDRPRSDSA